MRYFFLGFLPFSLPGFEIEQAVEGETGLTIKARAVSLSASCPSCHQISRRIHSYYSRCPADLPVSGRRVRLVLHVRRFRCPNPQCRQQTFVERLPDVVPVQARRTTRLLLLLDLMAIVLSAQAGSRLV